MADTVVHLDGGPGEGFAYGAGDGYSGINNNNSNMDGDNAFNKFMDPQDVMGHSYTQGRIMFYTEHTGVSKAERIDGILADMAQAQAMAAATPTEGAKNKSGNAGGEGGEGGEAKAPFSNLADKLASSAASWLDVCGPTDDEMLLLSKLFDIHPLTSEDIMTEETREKCEVFANYYFICIRTFDHDEYSASYMQPINVYLIIFKNFVLSFHYKGIPHIDNVLHRIEQLKRYGMTVTPDWINYAVIDDVTDSFMPMMRFIELEVDSIDDLVLILKESEQSDMLRRIGHARKKVMQMLRLLSSKAEVLKTIMKRSSMNTSAVTAAVSEAATAAAAAATAAATLATGDNSGLKNRKNGKKNTIDPQNLALKQEQEYLLQLQQQITNTDNETSLYLGDIQDHVITMVQNLTHYEKTLSRSHSNYLAQISIEITKASNKTNDVVMKMTALASILLPLNVITGLFGMNVRVPGQDVDNYGWFIGIIFVMVIFSSVVLTLARKYKIV